MVRLNGRLYEVIGVFEKDPGLFGGFGVDQFAVIPLTNFHKNYPEIREVFLIASVRPDADVSRARDDIIEAMRRRRRVPHNGDNDFDVADANFFLDLWNQLTGAMVLLTGVISSIGLLVGGIGVMNIMLISVTNAPRRSASARPSARAARTSACSSCWRRSRSRASVARSAFCAAP
jgi:putative ABC transport system permease protein